MVLDVTKGKVSLREQPKQLEVGEAVPDFSMTTQEGKPLKLSDLRGTVVVLTFIYTRCPLPDFCPLMDRKFGELAQRIGAIPERAAHDSPDFALLRPRARHARSAGKARAGRGRSAPLVDFRRGNARGTGKDRPAAGALLRAQGERHRPQPLHGDHRSAGKTRPPGTRHRPQQVGKCRLVEDHLFTDSTRR